MTYRRRNPNRNDRDKDGDGIRNGRDNQSPEPAAPLTAGLMNSEGELVRLPLLLERSRAWKPAS